LRGQLKRFYVKQVETGDAREFDRKSEAELREPIAEQDQILASMGTRETKHGYIVCRKSTGYRLRSGSPNLIRVQLALKSG
jgi:hypothetical protein